MITLAGCGPQELAFLTESALVVGRGDRAIRRHLRTAGTAVAGERRSTHPEAVRPWLSRITFCRC